MIRITSRLHLDPADVEEVFVRASGPGGQNVNKVSSAVQIRYPIARLGEMPEDMRLRLAALAGRKLTSTGELVISAERFRSQPMNRADALERLVDLLRQAAVRPKIRIATKPSRAAKARRVEGKVKRGAVKQGRTWRPGKDE
jgi:ribosome-associated protein